MKKTIIYSLILLFFVNNLIFSSNDNISNDGNISIKAIQDDPVPVVLVIWIVYKILQNNIRQIIQVKYMII